MRLWIAMTLAAVGLAAGTWWLTRSPAPEQPEPRAAVSRDSLPRREVMASTLRAPPSAPIRRSANTVEPIAVVPETDAVAEPAPTPALPTNLVREAPDRLAPRPESGFEPMPWMPYAAEDAELDRSRREVRDRVARSETAEPPLLREFQETAEPPLDMPARASMPWRSHGKLPCSVK